jgi:hypothetical protein
MSGNNTKQAARLSKQQLRDKIFGAKPEARTIDFFGGQMELRQPTLGVVMQMRRVSQEDAMAQMLVNYAFVPGGDEHVFEETDAEVIKDIPFGPDMQRLTNTINDLLGITSEGLDKQVESAMKSPAEGPAEDSADGSGE